MKRFGSVLVFTALSLSLVFAQPRQFNVKAGKQALMTAKEIASVEKRSSGASIGADKNSVVVKGKNARIVVRTGPKSDMMSYRLMGIRNPTITVPAGAKLIILFVNVDDDMLHDLHFTVSLPPFESKVNRIGSVGSSALPPMKGKSFSTQKITFTAPTKVGTYTYLCTTAGHAAAGMFGKLVVK